MTKMVGFYTELDPHDALYTGSILDAFRNVPADNEEQVVAYLEAGVALIDIMEACHDVITGDRYIVGCSSVFTDGLWIWRKDLPYYVRRYHLELDAEFLNQAAGNGYLVPRNSTCQCT